MPDNQNTLFARTVWSRRAAPAILQDARALHCMWKEGVLGGERMPEDAHPPLKPASKELYHYFTLGMALNYQRNSYRLWDAATAAFTDADTQWVFDPRAVLNRDSELRYALCKHRVALQPRKHTETWYRLCTAIVNLMNGDIRRLFVNTGYQADAVLDYIRVQHKKEFPYLSGPKISNYWLYVLEQYTDLVLHNRRCLSVAPDTHVIQSSKRLGLVDPELAQNADAQEMVTEAWTDLLAATELVPIDMHTPLWLWSKARFPTLQYNSSDGN